MPKCDFNKVACKFLEIALRHGDVVLVFLLLILNFVDFEELHVSWEGYNRDINHRNTKYDNTGSLKQSEEIYL